MIFADHTPDRQAQIVARAWQAIGVPSEHCTDELMGEWIAGLYELTLDEIKRGVDACKRSGRTEPVNRFVELCRPAASLTAPSKDDSSVAKREKARIAAIMRGEEVETKEVSYSKLGLHTRRGAA